MWPDFDGEDLAGAVREFRGRERRFGGVPAMPAARILSRYASKVFSSSALRLSQRLYLKGLSLKGLSLRTESPTDGRWVDWQKRWVDLAKALG